MASLSRTNCTYPINLKEDSPDSPRRAAGRGRWQTVKELAGSLLVAGALAGGLVLAGKEIREGQREAAEIMKLALPKAIFYKYGPISPGLQGGTVQVRYPQDQE
ncbi:hypothetical protein WJX72_001165 [[Myrmecia] bisecta]|uniref:Uncharacterized protein n=1 Tax=[Myrmecia] bisecta TaxID=41462 RepID=A0AAW1P803_9CHLO